jgi:MFS transporter, NNP family, nitrate/nitrite transporter
MLNTESQIPNPPVQFQHQADRIDWFNFRSPAMRAFHCTWIAFFTCFFAWFGLAPLMPLIREEMQLQPWQVGNLIVASVAATILARLIIGPLCDRFGPRLTYSWLLGLCSLPVMGVGLANSYETLLLFRFAIGTIGASFVVTQFHTSIMFSKKCVGAANAAAAGWGNLGGGITQQVMPLAVSGLIALGISTFWAWRGAMFLAGLACLAAGIGYYFFTQDAPDGSFRQLRAAGQLPRRKTELAGFWLACRDGRVWALFVAYAASFGIELTMDNVAATYFFDHFNLSAASAGFIAGLFGAMNLFARFLGGWLADRFGNLGGLAARIGWLAAVLLAEGALLILFGRVESVALAIPALLVLGLFVKMANGAAYAVVPLIHRGNLGAVAGIVGAGGNVGAVLAGFLFRAPTHQWPHVLQALGIGVLACATIPLVMAFRQQPIQHSVEEPAALELAS